MLWTNARILLKPSGKSSFEMICIGGLAGGLKTGSRRIDPPCETSPPPPLLGLMVDLIFSGGERPLRGCDGPHAGVSATAEWALPSRGDEVNHQLLGEGVGGEVSRSRVLNQPGHRPGRQSGSIPAQGRISGIRDPPADAAVGPHGPWWALAASPVASHAAAAAPGRSVVRSPAPVGPHRDRRSRLPPRMGGSRRLRKAFLCGR